LEETHFTKVAFSMVEYKICPSIKFYHTSFTLYFFQYLLPHYHKNICSNFLSCSLKFTLFTETLSSPKEIGELSKLEILYSPLCLIEDHYLKKWEKL
jgi:hypothetical protein